ncbi:MAG: PilZ domain-containing protein [Clostridiaceae bacterium]|nr:PilZ domain-containing protein [Clostridiaceae bacterium]
MEFIDINTLKENDIVKFINPNKTLVDGRIRKVSKECVGITINTRQDAYREFSQNQCIELILVRKHEALRCTSVILGSKQTGFEQAVIISLPKLVLGIDRREFERISIVMKIEYSPLPCEVEYESLSKVEQRYFRSFRKTYTIDISAGGVNFILSRDEEVSNFVLVALSVKDENILVLCKKIRVETMEDPRHKKVAYKYNDIKKQHRQLILDFVSEKSKELNNKERAI